MRGDVEQAIQLMQSHDSSALDKALALLQDTVYSFSMKVCGHHEDAEDTMQDVLLKSIPHLVKFDSPQALKVWLYKVARNCCMSRHRRTGFSRARNLSLEALMPSSHELTDLLSSPRPSPEESLVSDENARHLKHAIMAVPLLYRMVLVLHDMEELSTTEVAQIMSLREVTVRVRLHRARLFLRRQLAQMAGPAGPITIPTLHAAAEEARPLPCRRLFAALSDYMDGVIDDARCNEMDRHLPECEPCQAFLASLKNAVAQCQAYAPRCDEHRAQQLRNELLRMYQQAVSALSKASTATTDPHAF